MLTIPLQTSNRYCVAEPVAELAVAPLRRAIEQRCGVETAFALIDTAMPPTNQTLFKIATDGRELLLVGCLVYSDLWSTAAADAPLDSLEVVFDPYHDHLGYQQFVFQAGAPVFETRHYPYEAAHSTSFADIVLLDWDMTAGSDQRQRGHSQWFHARFRVPELFRAGACCGFNIARSWAANKEVSAWNQMSGHGVQDAAGFGHLYLEAPAVELAAASVQISASAITIQSSGACDNCELQLVDPHGDIVESVFSKHATGWQLAAATAVRMAGRYRLRTLGGSVEPDWLYFDMPVTLAKPRDFAMGMVYDVNDDFGRSPYTPELLRQELSLFAAHGVRRIYWIDTPPVTVDPEQLPDNPSDNSPAARANRRRRNNAVSYRQMGDILPAAAAQAKQLGLEFVSIYKPFDQLGPWINEHERAGRPESTMHRHPHWQVEPVYPVQRLRFWSRQPIPALTAADLSILVSADNQTYTAYQGPVRLVQGRATRPDQRWTPAGNMPEATSREDWYLELAELAIDQPFVAVRIHKPEVLLTHRAHAFLDVTDAQGQALQPMLATGGQPESGLRFWDEWRSWRNISPNLLEPYAWQTGWNGFTVQLPENLACLLEPMHPLSQDFWLRGLGRSLDTAADAVSVRTLCHHKNVMDYMLYAYAPPVREAFQAQFGREPSPSWEDCQRIRELRGECYTQFLQQAKTLAVARGKKLVAHFEPGIEVALHQAQRMQFTLDWQKWLREGLIDEIMLKWFGVHNSFIHEQVLPLARKLDIPVHICDRNSSLKTTLRAAERASRLVSEARAAGFAGYHFYEAADYLYLTEAGVPQLAGQASGALHEAARGIAR